MRADKIAIMTLVNEGKMSPAEGYRLYEALDSRPDADEQQEREHGADRAEDGAAQTMREKVHGIYQEAEPSLRSIFLSALETAASVAETVAKKVYEELG